MITIESAYPVSSAANSRLRHCGSPAEIGAPAAHVTQVALAEYVGSAREVVSRCLRSLSKEGVVAIGRGSVRILNEPELQRLAG
jgi:CRP-like cAMP-binding protein